MLIVQVQQQYNATNSNEITLYPNELIQVYEHDYETNKNANNNNNNNNNLTTSWWRGVVLGSNRAGLFPSICVTILQVIREEIEEELIVEEDTFNEEDQNKEVQEYLLNLSINSKNTVPRALPKINKKESSSKQGLSLDISFGEEKDPEKYIEDNYCYSKEQIEKAYNNTYQNKTKTLPKIPDIKPDNIINQENNIKIQNNNPKNEKLQTEKQIINKSPKPKVEAFLKQREETTKQEIPKGQNINNNLLLGNSKNINTNNNNYKKPTKKALNCLEILKASSLVSDKNVNGFDFDEEDFMRVDNKLLSNNNLSQDQSPSPHKNIQHFLNNVLCLNLDFDWMKLRTIFTYLTLNIEYVHCYEYIQPSELGLDDSSTFKPWSNEDLYNVLFETKVVDQFTMAVLFQQLCDLVNIKVEIVYGTLKDSEFLYVNSNSNYNSASGSENLILVNHAWIAVKIQGYNRLIDCALAHPKHPFNTLLKLDTFYFLTNPLKIIFTHFPLLKQKQYLEPPISINIFTQLPFANSLYFDYMFSIVDLIKGPLIVTEDETLNLKVIIPPQTTHCKTEIEMFDDKNNDSYSIQNCLSQLFSKNNTSYCKVFIRLKGKNNDSGVLKFYSKILEEINNPPELQLIFSLKIYKKSIVNKQPDDFVQLINTEKFFVVEPINIDLLYNITYTFFVIPKDTQINTTLISTTAATTDNNSNNNNIFKVVLRSPTSKILKFIYYPSTLGYIATTTLRERGQWAVSYINNNNTKQKHKIFNKTKNQEHKFTNIACYRCI